MIVASGESVCRTAPESGERKRVASGLAITGHIVDVYDLDDGVIVRVGLVGRVLGDSAASRREPDLAGAAVRDLGDDEPVTGLPVADAITGLESTGITERGGRFVLGDERLDTTGVTQCPSISRRRDATERDFERNTPEVFATLLADLVIEACTRAGGQLHDVRRAARAVDGVCSVAERSDRHRFGPRPGGAVVHRPWVRCKWTLLTPDLKVDFGHRGSDAAGFSSAST